MTIVSSVRLLKPNPLVNIVVSQDDLDALNRESHKLLVKKTEKAVLARKEELVEFRKQKVYLKVPIE